MTKNIVKYEFLLNQKLKKKESLDLERKISTLKLDCNALLKDIKEILHIEKTKTVFRISMFNYKYNKYDVGYNLFFIQIILQNEKGKEIGSLFFKDDNSKDFMNTEIHNAYALNNENTYEKKILSIVENIRNIKHKEFYLDLNANIDLFKRKMIFQNKKTFLFKNKLLKEFYYKIVGEYLKNKNLNRFLMDNRFVSLDLHVDNKINWGLKRMNASKITKSKRSLLNDFNYKEFIKKTRELNVLPDGITNELIDDTKNMDEILEVIKLLDY